MESKSWETFERKTFSEKCYSMVDEKRAAKHCIGFAWGGAILKKLLKHENGFKEN